jgi:hypothetical protein
MRVEALVDRTNRMSALIDTVQNIGLAILPFWVASGLVVRFTNRPSILAVATLTFLLTTVVELALLVMGLMVARELGSMHRELLQELEDERPKSIMTWPCWRPRLLRRLPCLLWRLQMRSHSQLPCICERIHLIEMSLC